MAKLHVFDHTADTAQTYTYKGQTDRLEGLQGLGG